MSCGGQHRPIAMNEMRRLAEHQSRQPNKRERTGALWRVAGMIAVVFMGSTLVTPLYVLYRQAFGFSAITLTLVYAVYVVGNLAALTLLGRLSDQIGRRRVALPAMGVAAIGALVFLFADSTGWLYLGRILSGFVNGLGAGAGTAWLAELDDDKAHATVVATAGNFAGLAAGPLLSGVLAEYAPWPLHLSYVVYLVIVGIVAALIARTRETVEQPVESLRQVSLEPRLGVPAGIRHKFIAPAATAFATFAFVGFYAALAPSILADGLHVKNHAVAGAVVFELFIVAMVAVIATRRLDSRTTMLGGLALLVPSLALVVAAEFFASMPVLLAATALSGVAAALGYRGSLQVVNQIAPADRRAEVVSSYLVTCFIGNSLPVIGVGVLTAVSSSVLATTVFAVVTGLIAIAAFFIGRKYTPSR
jgi:Major Facilitator Superfamily